MRSSRRVRGFNAQFGEWTTPTDERIGQREQYNFPVKRVIARYFPEGHFDPEMFPKHHVLYREDTKEPLGIVTKRYQPVLHTQFLDRLDNDFKAQGLYFVRRTGVRNNGAELRAEYRFPDVRISVPTGNGKRDDIDMTLHVGNSYDKSTSLFGRLGAFRLVCSNGMMIGIIAMLIKRRHTTGLHFGSLMTNIAASVEEFHKAGEQWEKWSQQPLNGVTVMAFLREQEEAKVLPKRTVDAIIRAFSAPAFESYNPTKWGFYNAITQVASHEAQGQASVKLLQWANQAVEQIAA